MLPPMTLLYLKFKGVNWEKQAQIDKDTFLILHLVANFYDKLFHLPLHVHTACICE